MLTLFEVLIAFLFLGMASLFTCVISSSGVIPAKAGIQRIMMIPRIFGSIYLSWIPAFAGMTRIVDKVGRKLTCFKCRKNLQTAIQNFPIVMLFPGVIPAKAGIQRIVMFPRFCGISTFLDTGFHRYDDKKLVQ